MPTQKVKINRAPVLTLWAAVVAERLGYDPDAALTLGKALAGLNAQSKGRRLGIFKPSEAREEQAPPKAKPRPAGEPLVVSLLGRSVPAVRTKEGIRALAGSEAMDPESVRRYLEKKLSDDLAAVRAAMQALAEAYAPDQLAAQAFKLYEEFRPKVPEGKRGWGAAGELDIGQLRALAKRAK